MVPPSVSLPIDSTDRYPHLPKPWPRELWPDMEGLVTEDDTPVDNLFSEKQQRLLTEPLYTAWTGAPKMGFLATANVGLFYQPGQPPLVPDAMLSLHVKAPQSDVGAKHNRSYFIWKYGKPPEVVIEVVSNREGGEDSSKLTIYEGIGVTYYAIYDPYFALGKERLRIFALHQGHYIPHVGGWFPKLGLGLRCWQGVYEDMPETWLRWHDGKTLLATGPEYAEQARWQVDQERRHAEQERQRAEQERQRAEQERQRAEQEKQHAEQERQRADNLAAQLRAMGIEPRDYV